MEEKIEEETLKNPAATARLILNSDDRDRLIGNLLKIIDNANNKNDKNDKHLKKMAKKVLYILKSRGINVDNLISSVGNSSKTKIDGETKETELKNGFNVEPFRAFLYIPDSLGNSRMIVSFYNNDQAGYELFDIIYNLDEGIKQFGDQKVSKSMIKRIVENGHELVEIPVSFALARMNDLLKIPESRDKVPIRIRYYIRDVKIEIHPILKIYPAQISGIISTEEERELFSRPEIARLMIPDKYTNRYREEIVQAKNSILIINNMTPEERINQTVERFIQYYFTHERLSMYRNLLLDIALFLHSQGESLLAKRLVSYAEELIKPIGDISKHPLVQLLIYKSFFID